MKTKSSILLAALLPWGAAAQTSSLIYSSVLGANGETQGVAIAADTNQNSFITGYTKATNLATTGAFQKTFTGSQDAYVAEFNATGVLVFFTYLGGSGLQSGQGIALDTAGNIFVTGFTTSTNFPIKNALQTTNAGSYDAFVAKFSPGGSNLVFSTYLGGKNIDTANGIVIDTNDNPIITGYTQSSNFPAMNAAQPNYGGNGDAFVAKLQAYDSGLLYSTYLGGSNNDNGPSFTITSQTGLVPETGGAVGTDLDGNAYVTGWTYSTNFPVTNAFQPKSKALFSSAHAAFVTKLDPDGNFVYSTYLGGEIADAGRAIAADLRGYVYVAGNADTDDLPITNAWQPFFSGGGLLGDAFVAAFDSTGTNVVYCTYLGGSGDEEVTGLAVAEGGVVAVTGFTDSPNFPVANAIQPAGHMGLMTSATGNDPWSLASTGLTHPRVDAIAVDPFDPLTLYALAGTLCQSTDGGAHWASVNAASSSFALYSSQEMIAFDPSRRGVVYFGAYGGVSKTVNGGVSWVLLTNGLPSGIEIEALAVDPSNPANVYAGTYPSGVFKSSDGGTNWTPVNNGLSSLEITAVLVDPLNSSNVYAAVDNFSGVCLFKSTNAGASWSGVNALPHFEDPVIAMAVSPVNPAALYVLVGDFLENATLCLSTNGGASWTQVLQMLNGEMNSFALAPPLRPQLTIRQGNANAIVTWPASFTNYVLQTASTLSAPLWQNASPTPTLAGANYSVTLPIGAAEGFYRLASTNAAPPQPVIYVGCDQASLRGVIQSVDGGATWHSAGLIGDTVVALAVNPINPNIVYAGLSVSYDAFVATFTTGGQLYASTFLGGSAVDYGYGVATDGLNVFVTGSTLSPDFPTQKAESGTPQRLEDPSDPAIDSPDTGGFTAGEFNMMAAALTPCPDKAISGGLNVTIGRPSTIHFGNAYVLPKPSELPPGLSFEPEASGFVLTGTPTKLGTYTFTVAVRSTIRDCTFDEIDTIYVVPAN